MKIGILTFHRAHNYGALLQTYALMAYLLKMGHFVEVIDYWPKYHADEYKLIPNFWNISFKGKIKSILLLLLSYSKTQLRSRGYKKFINEQFNLTDIPKFISEIELNYLEYDLIVYGSDQIWRKSNYPKFKGFSDVYFGAFPERDIKKITYAASMGIIEVNENEKLYINKMLNNFNSVSVRENELKQFIEEVSEIPISLVLDPVFLLDKNEWFSNSICSKSLIKEKYIFFYQLTPSNEAILFTNRLKEKYGYKVIEIRGRVEPFLFGSRYFQTASPYDFISLIKNAEIVVSTSFHGVAFSLIFEKQFYALGMNKNSRRVQSLLDNLSISNRLLKNSMTNNLDNQLNYKQINIKLNVLKKQSFKYLFDNIDNRN